MTTETSHRFFGKPWALLLMVAVGVAIAMAIVKNRPVMEHSKAERTGTPAGVIELQQQQIRPQIIGYGEVRPDRLLDIRAEISGRVETVHPQLKEGAILPANSLMLTLDKRDVQLARAQARAQLNQRQQQLAELQLNDKNTRTDLKLVKQKLALSRKELARNEALRKKQSLSQSAYDRSRIEVIQLQQEVQKLNAQLQALPYQLAQQQAQIDIAESDLATTERNLARTEIRLPFAARITRVSVETEAVVSPGSALFTAQSLDRVQVNVQVPADQFGLIVAGGVAESISIDQLLIRGDSARQNIMAQLDLRASAQLAGNDQSHWPATVARTDSNVDPQSRTVGVIVTIDNPYRDIRPGVKPPLLEGMFMKVTLQGPATDFVVLPRSAVHENTLYQLDTSDRLQRAPVSGHSQGAMLLVKGSTLAGQRIVTSDLFPAINGMQLTPFEDTHSAQQVKRWVEGR